MRFGAGRILLLLLGTLLASCRGEKPRTAGDATLARLVDSLRQPVERAAGLRFKRPPR